MSGDGMKIEHGRLLRTGWMSFLDALSMEGVAVGNI
jgi:hypothetical protein